MIIYISLAIIFFCVSAFALTHGIKMKWYVKLTIGTTLMSIIGVGASISTRFNIFHNLFWNIFFPCLAIIFILATSWVNKQGRINEND